MAEKPEHTCTITYPQHGVIEIAGCFACAWEAGAAAERGRLVARLREHTPDLPASISSPNGTKTFYKFAHIVLDGAAAILEQERVWDVQ